MVALYAALRPLEVQGRFDRGLYIVVMPLVAYRLVTMLQAAVAHGVGKMILADGADVTRRATAATVTFAAQGFIWVGASLFVLSNLGFNVTSMIAGLGISGIAVALAAQAVLGDLFSAVAIYLDKPFVVGDVIKVGDLFGTVEHIGVKDDARAFDQRRTSRVPERNFDRPTYSELQAAHRAPVADRFLPARRHLALYLEEDSRSRARGGGQGPERAA